MWRKEMWGTVTCVKNRSVCRISTSMTPLQKPAFAAGAHRKPQNSSEPQPKCVHSAACLCTQRPRRGRGVGNVLIHRAQVAKKWSGAKKAPTMPSIAPFGVAKRVPLTCVPSVQRNQWVRRPGQTRCVRSASLTTVAPSARRPRLQQQTSVRGAKLAPIRHAPAAAARRARV